MCDVPVDDNGTRCGRIFSELDDNWSTGNVTVMRRDRQTGKRVQVTEAQDRCRQHSAGIAETIDPEPETDLRQRIQALETADLEWRIKQAQQAAAARTTIADEPSTS